VESRTDEECGKNNLQVEYKKGWGKVTAEGGVEVQLEDGGSESIKAKNIIIATGSEVVPLKGINIDEDRCPPPPCTQTHASHLPLPPSPQIITHSGSNKFPLLHKGLRAGRYFMSRVSLAGFGRR